MQNLNRQSSACLEVPKLPRGLIYVAAEAGCLSPSLLIEDSEDSAVDDDDDDDDDDDIIFFYFFILHKRASSCAQGRHTVLLRSDGQALAFGANEHNQCAVSRPVCFLSANFSHP